MTIKSRHQGISISSNSNVYNKRDIINTHALRNPWTQCNITDFMIGFFDKESINIGFRQQNIKHITHDFSLIQDDDNPVIAKEDTTDFGNTIINSDSKRTALNDIKPPIIADEVQFNSLIKADSNNQIPTITTDDSREENIVTESAYTQLNPITISSVNIRDEVKSDTSQEPENQKDKDALAQKYLVENLLTKELLESNRDWRSSEINKAHINGLEELTDDELFELYEEGLIDNELQQLEDELFDLGLEKTINFIRQHKVERKLQQEEQKQQWREKVKKTLAQLQQDEDLIEKELEEEIYDLYEQYLDSREIYEKSIEETEDINILIGDYRNTIDVIDNIYELIDKNPNSTTLQLFEDKNLGVKQYDEIEKFKSYEARNLICEFLIAFEDKNDNPINDIKEKLYELLLIQNFYKSEFENNSLNIDLEALEEEIITRTDNINNYLDNSNNNNVSTLKKLLIDARINQKISNFNIAIQSNNNKIPEPFDYNLIIDQQDDNFLTDIIEEFTIIEDELSESEEDLSDSDSEDSEDEEPEQTWYERLGWKPDLSNNSKTTEELKKEIEKEIEQEEKNEQGKKKFHILQEILQQQFKLKKTPIQNKMGSSKSEDELTVKIKKIRGAITDSEDDSDYSEDEEFDTSINDYESIKSDDNIITFKKNPAKNKRSIESNKKIKQTQSKVLERLKNKASKIKTGNIFDQIKQFKQTELNKIKKETIKEIPENNLTNILWDNNPLLNQFADDASELSGDESDNNEWN